MNKVYPEFVSDKCFYCGDTIDRYVEVVCLELKILHKFGVFGDDRSMLAVEEPQPGASVRPMLWSGYATDGRAALAAAREKVWN